VAKCNRRAAGERVEIRFENIRVGYSAQHDLDAGEFRGVGQAANVARINELYVVGHEDAGRKRQEQPGRHVVPNTLLQCRADPSSCLEIVILGGLRRGRGQQFVSNGRFKSARQRS
jgi:hypothetical protein